MSEPYVSALAVSSASIVLLNSVIEGYLVVDREHVLPEDNLTCLAISLALAVVVFIVCLLIKTSVGWKIDTGVMLSALLAQSFGGLTTFKRAQLRRNLRFHRIASGEMLGIVVGNGAVAIAFAEAGWGAYSLAFGLLGQYLLQSIVILALGFGKMDHHGRAVLVRQLARLSQRGIVVGENGVRRGRGHDQRITFILAQELLGQCERVGGRGGIGRFELQNGLAQNATHSGFLGG